MSNGYTKGPYSPIQWALSSSVGFFGTQWMSSSLAMSAAERVCMPRIICSGHAWCQHLSCHCWKLCTVSACFHSITHTPYTFTNWQWIFTGAHHTHKSRYTSYSKVCHGFGRPSIFNLTYLWYPLIAVQWHNLNVPITCLNVQSHDIISSQTCCYLIFWNYLVYLTEVENSKYGTRNTSTTGSTTGMNKDMPFILNNNHADGVEK